MKNLITKEMVEAATVDLPETYNVGLSFEKDYDGSIRGVNVSVVKLINGHPTVVYSKYREVDET